MLVIGTISAWLVTRDVTKPPDEAVAAADLVGHGDLCQTIAFVGRSKTGNVLHALQSMSGKQARVVSNERSTASELNWVSEEVRGGALELSSRNK